ncbi:MAG: hypothetical protein HY908_15730 [Myxococcales bacterium]|nr:hypothetical protein [Myxococcales bacterium]
MVGVLVGWVRCAAGPPAAPGVEGVAALLGRAVGGAVEPDELVWEGSTGALGDAFLGRPVLFLAARGDGPRDLFRARVRMGREGRPVSVLTFRDLTDTPLGDEAQLVARGHRAAFVTTSAGAIQSVTVLDLDGHPVGELPLGRRLMAYVEGWLDAATLRGVARTELVFGRPPPALDLELRGELLVLALGAERRPAALALAEPGLPLDTGGANEFAAEAWSIPRTDKPFAHFAIDVARELLGTEVADTLKALVFDARSGLVRAAHGPAPSAEPGGAAPGPLEATHPAGWPPARIAPLFKHPLEHEGEWRAPEVGWLPPSIGAPGDGAGSEPYLLETTIRPDPAEPFALVRMVAIDTRQLELAIEAGFEEPRPLTGPPGRGRIPKDRRERAVAAFNGAFQTKHGEYGMMVDRRLLLPPKPYAATVAVDALGVTHVGSWGGSDAVPEDFVSLRQNLDPLVEDGSVNPRGRTTWGFPLDGASYLTERSALCLTRSGHLVYAWGMETDADTLARALLLADCAYALHLDMNPGHVGFVYQSAPASGEVHTVLLAREMSIAPRRYLDASPKDFFYLTLRDTRMAPHGDLAWQPDGGEQPPPRARVAVLGAQQSRLGVDVELTAFAARRFEWRVVPGARETAGRTADASLEPADVARALAAISLGVAERKKNPRGLVLGGIVALPIREDLGILLAGPAPGALAVGLSVADQAAAGDASELPLLAEDGELRSEARRIGEARHRGAACLLADGTFVVARSRLDSSEASASALLSVGCRRVVALDRGKQLEAFVHRAGTETPPAASYDDTVLYALAIPEPGTARRLALP